MGRGRGGEGLGKARTQQENRRLQAQQHQLMETMKSGVLILDRNHAVINANHAMMAIWGIPPSQLTGRRLHTTELAQICPEIVARVESGCETWGSPELQCRITLENEQRTIAVTVRPILSTGGEGADCLLYCEDVTYHNRLQRAIRQLEMTTGNLQSANEKLETTNEELQSTNEKLEATNEELRLTSEELETTNEELQSVNEELQNMNEEIEARTRALNVLSSRYAETLQRMPWPVMVVDRSAQIQLWNAAARRMLGAPKNARGMKLEELPLLSQSVRNLLRRSRGTLRKLEPSVLRGQAFVPGEARHIYDVHFTPIMQGDTDVEGVLILFGPPHRPGVKRKAAAEKDSVG